MVLSRAGHSPVSSEEAVCYRKRLANSVSNSHTGNPRSILLVSSKVRSQFSPRNRGWRRVSHKCPGGGGKDTERINDIVTT